jgi:hypothetical protein
MLQRLGTGNNYLYSPASHGFNLVFFVEGKMFIRKSMYEKLLKQIQNQNYEIRSLNEKLTILAQFHGQQFKFNVGEGWQLTTITSNVSKFIEAKRKEAHLSNVKS